MHYSLLLVECNSHIIIIYYYLLYIGIRVLLNDFLVWTAFKLLHFYKTILLISSAYGRGNLEDNLLIDIIIYVFYIS